MPNRRLSSLCPGIAVLSQNKLDTCDQQMIPEYFAVTKHPRKSGFFISAKTGTFKARPVYRVHHQYAEDTK